MISCARGDRSRTTVLLSGRGCALPLLVHYQQVKSVNSSMLLFLWFVPAKLVVIIVAGMRNGAPLKKRRKLANRHLKSRVCRRSAQVRPQRIANSQRICEREPAIAVEPQQHCRQFILGRNFRAETGLCRVHLLQGNAPSLKRPRKGHSPEVVASVKMARH